MKLSKTDITLIGLVIAFVACMAFEFGGNYDYFFEWLIGEGDYPYVGLPSTFFTLVISWLYLISFVLCVIFELIHLYAYMKLFSYINLVSISVCFLVGLYGIVRYSGRSGGILCIGTIIYLVISIFLFFICRKKAIEYNV